MIYREIKLKSEDINSIITEILYEIASARVDSVELLGLKISNSDNKLRSKLAEGIIRYLKGIKRQGQIQFFATEDSFVKSTTEAIFLLNKYPELFSSLPAFDDEASILYIKL